MGALDGLKILDFSQLLPGPLATMYLADHGAEVLHVDSPMMNSSLAAKPRVEAEGASKNFSANHCYLGRNKKSICLDMKKPGATDIIYELVKEYDVVLEQFRPGAADRMGIGYEQLKKVNPNIIYCSLTGYGQTGPDALAAGHDINYIAKSGIMSFNGNAEGPVLYDVKLADVCSGTLPTIISILMAVYYRANTGKGQYIDISMTDNVIGGLLGPTGAAYLVNMAQGKDAQPPYAGMLLNGGSLYDFYKTKDGRFLSVGGVEPKFFANFCNAIGKPELAEGGIWPLKNPGAKDEVKEVIASKTLAEWNEIFAGVDACVAPVQNLKEALLEDEHTKARELLVEVPVLGGSETIKQIANPIKFSESKAEYKFAGVAPGYHNDDVLEKLGFDAEKVAALKESGAVAYPDFFKK